MIALMDGLINQTEQPWLQKVVVECSWYVVSSS